MGEQTLRQSRRLRGSWGSNVVDYLDSEGSNQVCVSVEVHDVEGMKTTMASPEIEAAKKAHGVLEPIVMFMENG